MKDLFIDLYEYNQHYNEQLYNIMLGNQPKVTEKAKKLFNHLLNAQHIWNHRIKKEVPLYGVWEVHPWEDLKYILEQNFTDSMAILQKADLETLISYTNSKGQTFSNSAQQILFHVINHATYHRAQIATEFKSEGLEPLATDYIFYKR